MLTQPQSIDVLIFLLRGDVAMNLWGVVWVSRCVRVCVIFPCIFIVSDILVYLTVIFILLSVEFFHQIIGFYILFYFLVPAKGPDITITATSTTFNITWTKLSEDDSNGVIINYEVCYHLGSSVFDDCSQGKNVSDVDNTELTGLKPAKTYTVAVRAYTSVGPGPYGASKTVTTKESGELRTEK